MKERIVTLHPDGKQGTNISREKYNTMRAAIEELLQAQDVMTFAELGDAIEARLADSFAGSIRWYYTTVKLDLEARGVIERVGQGSPQRLRLAGDRG